MERPKSFLHPIFISEIEEVIKISPRKWMQGEKKAGIEAGIYNVIFVRLKEGISLPEGLKKLNAMLKDEHWE